MIVIRVEIGRRSGFVESENFESFMEGLPRQLHWGQTPIYPAGTLRVF